MAQKTFEGVQKRIAQVTAEIAKLNVEYQKLKAEGKSNDEIQKTLSKRFETLTKRLTTLNNVSSQFNRQQTTTAKQATQVSNSLNKVTTQYQKLSNSLSNAGKSTSTFGSAFSRAFSPAAWAGAIANVIKFLGIYQILFAALEAVKEITLGSIKAFIEYEDAIGKLRAVTGANAEQTKLMSDAIRDTAVQTRFTATQVSALATSLAKLGATSEEIPNLILPISLAAQALGADLDAVGETVFKVSNQFGLSAAESATTAQTLVSAINSSALSLESFNTAIQYIGPIASQVGLSFSETSGYLETLADNGFSASRIGTGLRGIFIDLKESGVPLIDTLQKLADENISVARATDLVGKRAAAQLITILDNIDAIKEGSNENRRFAEALRSSAAQMNTAAGQLDILKSAYEDLKISIGDTITSTELFLDLLGILNSDSEELARGYRLLDQVFSDPGGFEIVSKSIEILSDGTVDASNAILSAISVVGQAGKSSEFINAFDAVNMAQIKLNGQVLSNADAFRVLEKAVSVNGATFATWLREDLGLSGQEVGKLTKALQDAGVQFGEIENDVIAIQGIAGIFEKQALAVQSSNQVSEERNRIEQEYADDVQRVKDLTIGSNASKEESRRIQKELNDEIKKTEEQRDKEAAKGILANKVLINQLDGRISGYRNVRKQIADLNDEDEDSIKAQNEARKKQLKLDKDGIELRRAQIKEEIRQIKKIRDERIKAIEAERDLQLKSAATSTERTQIEMKAAKAIKDANAEVVDSLEQVSEKTQVLIEDTTKLEIKYKTDFPEAFNDFALSFEKILFDIQDFGNEIVTTPQKAAEALLGQLDSVMAGFEQSMSEMKDFYGNSIQGQRDYAEASQREFDKLKDNLSDLVAEYYSTKAALEVALGPEVAAMVLKPLSDAIDAAEVKLNALGFKVKQGAEKIAKDTKESYRQLYIDGLEEALKTAIDALQKFNDVAFENTKDRIEREQDLVEARYQVESDILKSQLDNQLITEEEYRNKQQQLRKKQIGEENTLEKALFDASQRRDKQNATADYLQALASIIPNLILYDKTADPATLIPKSIITGALATAAYSAELSAIGQRKFIPKKFAEGGMVDGPSHSEGGVPFTVQGRGGYEMEGGEFIVNKRAARLHRQTLERINSSVKPQAQNGKLMFETGGVIPANGITASQLQTANGGAEATIAQLEYLRSIAETNLTISGNTSKPVRAYVSSSDLGTNDAERKIKERNTRI